MSRGAQQTTRNLTDQQLAQQNQAISQESQSDSQDRSLLMPTIQSLLNSQGYIPQQQSAINQQSLGASNTAFNALQEKAANRTAATNNSAGAAHPLGEFEWPPPLKLSPSRVRSRLPMAWTRPSSARSWSRNPRGTRMRSATSLHFVFAKWHR
jgi:hypothetical protein